MIKFTSAFKPEKKKSMVRNFIVYFGLLRLYNFKFELDLIHVCKKNKKTITAFYNKDSPNGAPRVCISFRFFNRLAISDKGVVDFADTSKASAK